MNDLDYDFDLEHVHTVQNLILFLISCSIPMQLFIILSFYYDSIMKSCILIRLLIWIQSLNVVPSVFRWRFIKIDSFSPENYIVIIICTITVK